MQDTCRFGNYCDPIVKTRVRFEQFMKLFDFHRRVLRGALRGGSDKLESSTSSDPFDVAVSSRPLDCDDERE